MGRLILSCFTTGACALVLLTAAPATIALTTGALAKAVVAQDQAPNRREFTIVAENFRFSPDRIEVSEDDLVRLALQAADQPYSFVIDAYRIVKRVDRGQTISFEFRADRPGTFTFYCNMAADPRCKEMRGTLVVRAR